jgi:hypothetical protein
MFSTKVGTKNKTVIVYFLNKINNHIHPFTILLNKAKTNEPPIYYEMRMELAINTMPGYEKYNTTSTTLNPIYSKISQTYTFLTNIKQEEHPQIGTLKKNL